MDICIWVFSMMLQAKFIVLEWCTLALEDAGISGGGWAVTNYSLQEGKKNTFIK